MRASARPADGLPSLAELGVDLTRTTRAERAISLLRPFVCAGLLSAVLTLELWWLSAPVAFLLFVAVVTVTHDVVHDALGLGRRATDLALFACGALLLESGHAYRCTHLRHHAVFPGPDDPEGDPARHGPWRAVAHGPVFLPRLWLWALGRTRGLPAERRWLALEGALLPAAVATGLLWPSRSLLLYASLAVAGSWVYPLLTVYLPHRGYGDTPLTQTHTLRGRLVPALFLELTYHLEHHLYPMVPSHRLPELSRRLEPVLRAAGVRPRRVP